MVGGFADYLWLRLGLARTATTASDAGGETLELQVDDQANHYEHKQVHIEVKSRIHWDMSDVIRIEVCSSKFESVVNPIADIIW